MHQPERPEATVPMPFIHPLSSPKDREYKKEIRRCASVATKVLTDDYTVDELKDQLKLANRLLSEANKVVAPKDAQKGDHVSCLKLARQRVIQTDNNWADATSAKAKEKYEDWKKSKLETLEEDMKKECSSNFVNFSPVVREEFSSDDHKYEVMFHRIDATGSDAEITSRASKGEELADSQETAATAATTSTMGSFL